MRLHGAIDISQIKHTWRGEWNPSEIYYLNDVVKYNGVKFVCIDTELSDNRKYGNVYKPTVANEYWQEFSYGYLWRGGWNYRDHYYPGDVVRWNDDWYICNTYNYGGHPVYENASLTTKWTKIVDAGITNKSSNHIWFANNEPIGWTRNMCSNGIDNSTRAYSYQTIGTINGNYEFAWSGRTDSTPNANIVDNYIAEQCNLNYDFWDYYDGYRPSITGDVPRCVQVVGHYSHVLILFDNGELYIWGYNGNYQGGVGASAGSWTYFPYRVGRTQYNTGPHRRGGTLRDVFIVKVASSTPINESTYIHCLALDSDGEVWSWGYSGYGQCGHGDNDLVEVPRKIERKFFDGAKIIDIWANGSGSYGTSYALDENGQIWAWGYGLYGALGIGNYDISTVTRPVKQPIDWTNYGGVKKITLIGNSTNNSHGGHVLTNDGSMWVFGGSHPYAGGFRGIDSTETYAPFPIKFSTLLQNDIMTNESLNQTELRQLSQSVDVVDNVEDFWSEGWGAANRILMKDKIRHAVWHAGYNQAYGSPMTKQQNQESHFESSNNPWANSSAVYPTPIDLGNVKDVKDVITMGEGAGPEHLYLNSDGRMMVAGNNSDIGMKGVGRNNTTAEFEKAAYVWERDLSLSNTPAQVRNLNNVSMIAPEGGFNGAFAITTDHKVRFWGYNFSTYALTPLGQSAYINNPIRLNCY